MAIGTDSFFAATGLTAFGAERCRHGARGFKKQVPGQPSEHTMPKKQSAPTAALQLPALQGWVPGHVVMEKEPIKTSPGTVQRKTMPTMQSAPTASLQLPVLQEPMQGDVVME